MQRIEDDIPAYDSTHAFRHTLAEDERESLAHMLMFPEHGIAGFIYPTMKGSGPAKARAALFGPGLAAPVQEEVELPYPEAMDFGDWQLGLLRMAVRDPHQQVDLAWHGQRIHFNGCYQALHPPYAFSAHPRGNPPYYGRDRTEQHGDLTCRVGVDGLQFEHRGWMIRDHSWGPRIWGLNQHHKWFHAATNSVSIHVFEMQSFGAVELRGYLWKDGKMSHIRKAEFDVGFDDAMIQQSISVAIEDAIGRYVSVRAKTFANIKLEWDPAIYLCEAALTVEIADETGVGWAEFCWNRSYFDLAHPYVKRFFSAGDAVATITE
jgi:hypothetical protein